jgi:hypothetical protein
MCVWAHMTDWTLLWTCNEAVHHGRNMKQSKMLMSQARKRERERERFWDLIVPL